MTIAPMVVSFGTQVWLARELGRLGLGEYHATALFVIVLTTVLFVGFPSVSSQRIAGLDESHPHLRPIAASTAFTLALAFAVAMALVAALSAAPFARLFGVREPSAWMLGLAAFGAATGSFVVHVMLARLDLRAATTAIVAQPLGVGIAIGLGSPWLTGGAALAVSGFVASGVVAIAILLHHGVFPGLDRSEAAYLLRRSGPALRLTYPALITGWIDRALVGVLLGPAALGAFVAATALVEMLHRSARATGSLAVSAYARLATDAIGISRVLDSHLRLGGALFIVAGAVFISAGSGMLSLVYGETFTIATTTLRLLSVAALPMTIAVALAGHSIGADLRTSSRLLILLAIMHLTATTVGTLLFHIAGTALANVLVWGIGMIFYLRQAAHVGAPVQLRTMLHIVAVAAPTFSMAWIVGSQEVPWPVAGTISGVLATVPVLLVLVQDAEWRLVRRVLGSP